MRNNSKHHLNYFTCKLHEKAYLHYTNLLSLYVLNWNNLGFIDYLSLNQFKPEEEYA